MDAVTVFRVLAIGYLIVASLLFVLALRKPAHWEPRRYRWLPDQTRSQVVAGQAANVVLGVALVAVTFLA